MGRSALLALLAVGCNSVFGVAPPLDASGASDGSIDATGSLVISNLELANDVATSELVGVTLRVAGQPFVSASYQLSATTGTIDASTGSFVTDDNGNFSRDFLYTAPSTAGSDTITATIPGDIAEIDFPILQLTSVGNDSNLDSTLTIAANSLFAIGINVSTAGKLRAIGMHGRVSLGNARFGLYDRNAMLLTESAPVAVDRDGRITAPLAHVDLRADDYYVAILTDNNVTIGDSNTGSKLLKATTFATGMPPSLAGSQTATGTLSLFIEVAH